MIKRGLYVSLVAAFIAMPWMPGCGSSVGSLLVSISGCPDELEQGGTLSVTVTALDENADDVTANAIYVYVLTQGVNALGVSGQNNTAMADIPEDAAIGAYVLTATGTLTSGATGLDTCRFDVVAGDNGNGGGNFLPTRDFAGTNTCLTCHGAAAVTGTNYTSFLDTGHPYKLNQVPGNQAPEYPITELPRPPTGLEWSDVSFVIGGFRYKYRVIDNDGFIVLGPSAQYNFPTDDFSAYNNDDDHFAPPDATPGPWAQNIGRKPYNCGKCHTTAYDADFDNHYELPGFVGDWIFDGVQCEECHGPGAAHAAAPSDDNINGDPQTDVSCAKCHVRSPDGIAASGGFIRHHEQYDEFSRTAHAGVMADGCMTCHNVHEPIFDQDRLDGIQALADADGADSTLDLLPPPPGIIRNCTDCHVNTTVNHAGPQTCKTCHMAFTVKSAVATGPDSGDIRSHAWLINTDPEALSFTDANFVPVPRDDPNVTFSNLNAEGQPFITLDFACLRCHQDQDKDWAAENSAAIHGDDG